MGRHRFTGGYALLAATLGILPAQTRVDLRTQAKTVDFSALTTTPFQVGASLPVQCSVGQAFFKTTEAAGYNLFSCTSANVWTRAGLLLPATDTTGQKVLTTDGTTYSWSRLSGDLSGAPGAATVQKIQGQSVSASAPSDGQLLRWSAALSQWIASTETPAPVGSVFGRTGGVTAQSGDYTAAQVTNAADRTAANSYAAGAKQTFSAGSLTAGARIAPTPLPGIPLAGDLAVDTDDNNRLKTYDGSTWVAASVPPYSGSANRVLGTDGTNPVWKTLGGDVSGPPEAMEVQRLQGRTVSGVTPSANQLLRWNATNSQWEPSPESAAPVSSVFGRTGAITQQAGDYTAAQVSNAVDHTVTTTYTPGAKQVFVPSGTSAGLRIQPGGLPSTPQAGDVVIDSTDGYRLKTYDGSQWSSAVSGTPVNGNYGTTFTAQTTVTILGTTHGMGSARLLVDCYDNSTPPQKIEPNTVTVDSTTFDVTTTFSTAQSGLCVVNGGGSGGSGGSGGAVTSVFGRTGDVTAYTGDYTFAQLSGTVTDSQVATGINATKIGTGAVDTTHLNYLASTRADVQQQIDGKADTGHTHTLGGDAQGSVSGVTVTGIRNRSVAATVPLNGQALVWNNSANWWEPSTVASGGGGGGASMATQLGDLVATRTSSTVLTVGAGCSFLTPCNARVGGTVYAFNSNASMTLASGATGTVYIYVDGAGLLTAGHNMTLASTTGITERTGVAAFPANVLPLYTWTATGGTWDNNGGNDKRAFLSAKVLAAGTGITILEAGQSVVSVDTATVPTYLTTTATLDFPPLATAACSADLTLPLPGAATGDPVAAGWPAGLEAGLIGMMRVSASGQVAVRMCNFSGGTIDPAAAVFRATVVRSF